MNRRFEMNETMMAEVNGGTCLELMDKMEERRQKAAEFEAFMKAHDYKKYTDGTFSQISMSF